MLHAQCAAFRGSRAYTDADVKARQAGQTFNGLPEGLTRFGLASLIEPNRAWLGLTATQAARVEFLILKTWDQDWEPGQRPITWVSVKTTARKFGVTRQQIRNTEHALNEAGVMTWNDSAYHERW